MFIDWMAPPAVPFVRLSIAATATTRLRVRRAPPEPAPS